MSDRQLADGIRLNEPERVGLLLAPGSTIDLNRPADATAFKPASSALGLAILDIDMVRLLLQHGANPNLQDQRGRTALHHAVRLLVHASAFTAVTRVLLEEGRADPNIPDEYGETPFHEACFSNHINAAEAMLDHGADMMMTTGNGRWPILEAVVLFGVTGGEDAGILRMLLERGGNANHRGRHGLSLLHLSALSAFSGCSETMKILLEFGANANAGDCSGRVPLQVACEESGSTDSIFILFQRMVAENTISLNRNRN